MHLACISPWRPWDDPIGISSSLQELVRRCSISAAASRKEAAPPILHAIRVGTRFEKDTHYGHILVDRGGKERPGLPVSPSSVQILWPVGPGTSGKERLGHLGRAFLTRRDEKSGEASHVPAVDGRLGIDQSRDAICAVALKRRINGRG